MFVAFLRFKLRTHTHVISFIQFYCMFYKYLSRSKTFMEFCRLIFHTAKKRRKKHKEWTKLWGILLFAFIWYGCVHHGAIVLAIFHKIWKYMKSLWFFFWPKWNGMIFLALMRSNAAEWTFSSKNVEMKTTK